MSSLSFTYADDIHEAVHAVADLEEQVLALPLRRGAEGGPDEPGDAGDEEKGTQNNGRYLHLLYHRQRNGLPLQEENKVWMSGGRSKGVTLGGGDIIHIIKTGVRGSAKKIFCDLNPISWISTSI